MLTRVLLQRPHSLFTRHHRCLIRGLRRISTGTVSEQETARPPVPKGANLTGGNLQKFQKTELAQRLWNEGNHVLYKATWQLSCFRFITYGLGVVIVTFLVNEMRNGFLDMRENARRGVHSVVIWTQVGLGAFLASIAGLCFHRAGRQVETIRIIKEANNYMVRIRSRGALPFMKKTAVFRPYDLEAIPKVNHTPHPIPHALTGLTINTTTRMTLIGSVLSNSPKHILRGMFWFIGGFKQLFGRAATVEIHGYRPDLPQPLIFYIDLHGDYPEPYYQNREPYLFKLLAMKRKAETGE